MLSALDWMFWKKELSKKKLMGSISKSVDCDSTSIFFKSMAMTVKKFPPYLILKGNASLLQLIDYL